MEDVSAKRSDAINKKKHGKNVSEEQMVTVDSGNAALLRQVSSSSSNESDVKNIDADIEIDMPHIIMSSPTTPWEDRQNSFFFHSGNRAPSPFSLQQQFTETAVPDEERDTFFTFASESSAEVSSKSLPFHWHARQTIFDEVDNKFYGETMRSYEKCFGGQSSSNDSVEGSLGVVSNSTSNSSSSGNSCQDLDEQWGSDSDIEDCLLLGMDEILPKETSLR